MASRRRRHREPGRGAAPEHGARVPICGFVSQYNEREPVTPFTVLGALATPSRGALRVAAYAPGQLRTLQRHVKRWRAAHGPDKEVFFAQRHRAGEAAQTDFTSATELAVTIAGQFFAHMLCVVVLPYSNWQWATVCLSESIMAMRRGVQAALFQLGRVPMFHQTVNASTG